LIRTKVIYSVFLSGLCLSTTSWAGFFEMPEITEMPELERKSLLKDLDIPGVRDRDPDPEAGPRLNISKFKLEGIVEFPELGISKQDVDKLIEAIRFDLMDEYKILESGFTEQELEEISALLGDIEEETADRHVTEVDVQKLIWLVRDQRSKRGVTLGQIESVADRITQFYRKRGFILAKAYIPQQQVRDGVVTLTLLLGTLGEVSVNNNLLYDGDYLSSAFDDILTKPVTSSAIEEKLYFINDYPGIGVSGIFEPGSQVGDTKLNLNVISEHAYASNVRLDNHGSEQTGENRLYGEFFWQNPSGNADQLQMAALFTFNPDNATYGQIRYSTRLLSPRFSIAVGYSTNDFNLGQGTSSSINNLDLFGKTLQSDIATTYVFKRSRTSSYYADLIYEEIESQLRVGAFTDTGDIGLDDIVENVELAFRYDVLNEDSEILHQGKVKLVSGDFKQGADIGQDVKYSFIGLDYSLLTFWRLPYFQSSTRIIYRAALQFTDSPLASINQQSLAGPTRVRAYAVNQFSADNAFYSGVDWVFDAPDFLGITKGDSNWQNIIQPFLFLDAAWGEALSLVAGDKASTAQLYGAGFGFKFSYKSNLRSNLQFAFQLEEDFSLPSIEVPEDDYKIVLDAQYSFQ